MFFIFGWGRATNEDLGPTAPMACPNCHNDAVWHLLEHKRWFSLFFVPIFPYESKHALLCPICSRGFELNGQQLEHARQLNSAMRGFSSGSVSEAEVRARLASVPADSLTPAQADSDSHENDSQPISRCPTCSFESYNGQCTTCPDCRAPLQPVHA
jgi:hypothetical protein